MVVVVLGGGVAVPSTTVVVVVDETRTPNMAVQNSRDSQIGAVAEFFTRCSCFNYTFYTHRFRTVLLYFDSYILKNDTTKLLQK